MDMLKDDIPAVRQKQQDNSGSLLIKFSQLKQAYLRDLHRNMLYS